MMTSRTNEQDDGMQNLDTEREPDDDEDAQVSCIFIYRYHAFSLGRVCVIGALGRACVIGALGRVGVIWP